MILLDKKEKLFAVKGTIPTEIKEIEYEDINEEEDVTCNVLLVGDKSVGISSLILKSEKNIFNEKSSLEISFQKIKIYNIVVKLYIENNMGLEDVDFYIPPFRKNDIYVLIYSINDAKSFENINEWLRLIRKENINKNAKIFLVGNKSDLEKERVITKEMGMKFKEENNLEAFIEISAKNDDIRKVLFAEIGKCFEIIFIKISYMFQVRY